MIGNFSDIFLISVLILGLILSPLTLAEFSFAQGPEESELEVPEEAELEAPEVEEEAPEVEEEDGVKAAKKTEKLAQKAARLEMKVSQLQDQAKQNSEQIKQKLMQKIDKLQQRQQILLTKLESGEYFGKNFGGDKVINKHALRFDKLTANGIADSTTTETFAGDIFLENVVSKGKSMKYKVTGCELIGELVSYSCVFGKARAISAGQPGEKNSMIIIAFLEDESENRNTLKIRVDTDKPLNELGSAPVQVDIKKPQSMISNKWSIGGSATLEITESSVSPLTSQPAVIEDEKTVSSGKSNAPQLDFVEEVFIDFAAPAHGGSGQHPTTESSDFKLTQGGIMWFADSTVKYQIIGPEGATGGNVAIDTAVGIWDVFITTREFERNDGSPTGNLCGGVNSIQWLPIDGSGGVLSTASVCRNVATKEIVGFRITIDTGDSWSTDRSSGTFDVQNIVSHEFGHVAGLGHDNPPKSGCLSMYKFASPDEIQKRTLGLGDKLGMNALYSTGDTSAGPGCNL